MKIKQQTFLCGVNSCWHLCNYHFLLGFEVILCADCRLQTVLASKLENNMKILPTITA